MGELHRIIDMMSPLMDLMDSKRVDPGDEDGEAKVGGIGGMVDDSGEPMGMSGLFGMLKEFADSEQGKKVAAKVGQRAVSAGSAAKGGKTGAVLAQVGKSGTGKAALSKGADKGAAAAKKGAKKAKEEQAKKKGGQNTVTNPIFGPDVEDDDDDADNESADDVEGQ